MTRALFLDTTIQVDRILKEQPPERLAPLEALLSGFDHLVTCSYSRLEFKRVVIQNLALVLDYLCENHSFFRALQKAAAVGAGRPRRAATLENILAWAGFHIKGQIEVALGEDLDRKLALRAETYIRNAILYLWKRFDKSVQAVQDGTRCQRAVEGPRRRKDGSFDVAIPESRCRNRECDNANFFQSNLPLMKRVRDELDLLGAGDGEKLTDELEASRAELRAAIGNPSRLYDYKACVGVGDVWIHLECRAAAVPDFATTNYKESEVLCPLFGQTMHNPAK
jgi:hypothetical protein